MGFRSKKGPQTQAQSSEASLSGCRGTGFAGPPASPVEGSRLRGRVVVKLCGAGGGYFLNRSNGKVNLMGTPMRLLMNDCCRMVSVLLVTQ